MKKNNRELIEIIRKSKKEASRLNISEEELLIKILNLKEINQRVLEYLIDNKIYKIKDSEVSKIYKKYPKALFNYQELNILFISSLFFIFGYTTSLFFQSIFNIEHILIPLSFFIPVSFLLLAYNYCFRWYKEKELLLEEIIKYKKEKNQRVTTEYTENFFDY